MDRVLHQVRMKEEKMLRTANESSTYKSHCGQMQQQIEQLLRERSDMSEEFSRLHQEVGEFCGGQ